MGTLTRLCNCPGMEAWAIKLGRANGERETDLRAISGSDLKSREKQVNSEALA